MNLERIIPHIPSLDMKETADFLQDFFGFAISHESEHYTELHLDDNTLGILFTADAPNQQSIYLRVTDIETLWNEIENKIALFKPRPLFTQPYGMQEFHVVIPATNTLLFVGEPTNT